MITTASDYEWVSVSALSGYINGKILPQRDIDATGARWTLRYEDYLFLLEAFMERANWESAPSASITPGTRVLSGADLRGCILTAQNFPDFIDPAWTVPTAPVAAAQYANIRTTLGMPDPPLETVSIVKILEGDEVRKMYWNLKQTTRTVKSFQRTDLASSWIDQQIFTTQSGTQNPQTPHTNYGRLWNHRKGGRQGSPYSSVTITYNSALATFPHADSATLFGLVYSYNEDAQTGWYEIIALPCTVTAGVIAPPSLAGIAQTMCLRHGMNYTSAPAYIQSGGGTVEIQDDLLLMVDHKFPAEIDSLNWNWSPPSP